MTKNLKRYISRFTEEDRRAEERKKTLEKLRRLRKREEFRSFLAARHEDWLSHRNERLALGSEDTNEAVTVIEQVVEVELGETVETVA